MADNILLTISLLISKRPDTVRKCLDSVKPLLEAVPSELILTDTGCGEEVRSIIEEYTDHIIDFEWCRDFAKARNVGLYAAKGKWFMFLDDDEWFEDVTEIIDFFRTGEYQKYGMAAYNQRNYHNRQGSLYDDLAVGRMVRLDPGIEFMYPIHEVFNRVPGKVKKFKAFVHHYGYVFDTEEERTAHSNRNISLLLEEHRKYPGNQKHTLQLLKEYSAVGKWQESLDISLEGIEWIGRGEEILRFCEPSYYVNIIDAYIQLGRESEVIETGEKFLAEVKLDPLARACIHAQLSAAWLDRASQDADAESDKETGKGTDKRTDKGTDKDTKKQGLEKCLDYVQKYWDAYQLEKRQDDVYLQNITSVTSDCFAPQNVNIVLGNGICAAIGLQQFALAEKYLKRMERIGSRLFISNNAIKSIVDALLEISQDAGQEESATTQSEREKKSRAEQKRILTGMCDKLLEQEDLQERMRGYVELNISSCKNEGSKQQKIRIAAGLCSDYWYFHILRIVSQTGTPAELAANQKKVWSSIAESLPFITQYRVWEYLPEKEGGIGAGSDPKKDDGKSGGADPETDGGMGGGAADSDMMTVENLLSQVPLHVWRAAAASYSGAEAWDRVAEFDEMLAKRLEPDNWYWLAWSEAYLFSGLYRGQMGDTLAETLYAYGTCIRQQADVLYREEVMTQCPELLPSSVQVALFIEKLQELEAEGDYGEAVKVTREIIRLLPELAGAVKAYVEWLNKQMAVAEQERMAAQAQMRVLADGVKQKAKELIRAGEKEAAKQVLLQLKNIIPDDREVVLMLASVEKTEKGGITDEKSNYLRDI